MCCRVYANLLQLWLLAQHIQLQQVSTVIHTIVWNDLRPVNLVFNRLVCYWLCHRSPPISWQSPFMTRWKKQLSFHLNCSSSPPPPQPHTHTRGTHQYYQASTPSPGAHGIIRPQHPHRGHMVLSLLFFRRFFIILSFLVTPSILQKHFYSLHMC